MKKTLIALAVLGSIAGVAQAQSSVTVYGVVDVGLAHENNGADSVTRLDSGNWSGSRLGFKGTEDLGGGLSAIFTIESGFNADTGAQADAAKLFNRQAFVGLSGAFGAVKLGRQKNALYANVDTFDPFGNGLAGDSARLFSYNGSRTDNLITYGYAANGFRGELQYGLGEVAGNSSASRTAAGFVGYKNGPIDVVLTHQNIKNATDTDSTKMTLLGGNYNFGVVKAFATYAVEKGVVLNTATPLDQRDALLGLTAPVGAAGTLMVSYIRKTDKAADDADARQIAIGYAHALSKRTTLYTSYGQLRNDDSATYAGVPVAGDTDKLFNVGIRHTF
ncbi:MAG: porin [Oxalobacteraceae bacterium]|nr:porin [Oxalobacteraceae bacterium]